LGQVPAKKILCPNKFEPKMEKTNFKNFKSNLNSGVKRKNNERKKKKIPWGRKKKRLNID
jgi:hypothetical protein